MPAHSDAELVDGPPGAPDTAAAPLFDPDRDVLATPGSGLSGRVRAAHDEVRARIAAEGVRAHGEPLRTAPGVAVLHPLAEPELRRRVGNAVRCLERVVRSYPVDEELRAFLDVPEVLRGWIAAEPEPERLRVDFCRLDLLGGSLAGLRVLEFNASSPGGVLAVGLLNRFWRESSLGGLLAEWGAAPARFEERAWFADWLLGFGRAHGIHHGAVGLFHDPACNEIETQVGRQLRGRGRTTVALEPAEFDPDGDLRLGYLKHIPVNPGCVRGWSRFCPALADKSLVVPNPLAARWVAENKLCLAVLSDPRFRRLFTGAQRAALDALVPFSRKLGDGVDPAEVVADRARFVLKAPYGRCGEAVVLGRETGRDDWARLVRSRPGWLVQEAVEPGAVDGQPVRDLIVPVLGGQVVGYGSRMGSGPLLNVARGSAVAAVFGSLGEL
ncbi:hypothetical protein [Actinokineospora sp. NPDC004072]